MNINFQVWGLSSLPPPPAQDDILAFLHSTQKIKQLLCIFTSKNIPSTGAQLAAFLRRSFPQLCGDVIVEESTSKKLKKTTRARPRTEISGECRGEQFPPGPGAPGTKSYRRTVNPRSNLILPFFSPGPPHPA